jgi:hypothetical protein
VVRVPVALEGPGAVHLGCNYKIELKCPDNAFHPHVVDVVGGSRDRLIAGSYGFTLCGPFTASHG